MTGLKDYLENEATHVTVGIPPVGTMVGDARRTRRRRAWGAGSGALALVVAAGVGVSVLPDPGESRGTAEQTLTAQMPPAEGRWVGIEDVRIDVPADWTDVVSCPDTGGAIGADVWQAYSPEARGNCAPTTSGAQVSFMKVSAQKLEDLTGVSPTSGTRIVEGGERFRRESECTTSPDGDLCIGGVFFPGSEIQVTVSDFSTGSTALVDALLDSARTVASGS